jgi:pSer/pThr/pTyr-binding forkhead associated (FHA) protein
MARLRFLLDGKLHEWPLGSFVVTIGRSPGNTIVINERAVAAQHAEIVVEDGRYVLCDRGSKTGTRINGNPIERTALNDGDTIQIGSVSLRYHGVKRPTAETAAADVEAPPKTPETEMLDELVGSIRAYRSREQDARAQEIQRIQDEWEICLRLAEELKAKVGGDPRIKYFGIDRRANDIIIRTQRFAGGPQKLITVALRHPNYRDHLLNGLWLIRSEQQDRCLPAAQDVVNELVRELAFALA